MRAASEVGEVGNVSAVTGTAQIMGQGGDIPSPRRHETAVTGVAEKRRGSLTGVAEQGHRHLGRMLVVGFAESARPPRR